MAALRSLIITNNDEVFNYFSVILHSEFGLEIDVAPTCMYAIKHTYDITNCKLIVVVLPDETTQHLLDLVARLKLPIPIIFTADENHMELVHYYVPYHPLCLKISYNSNFLVLLNSIEKLIQISRRKEKRLKKEDYYSIPITLFKFTKETPFELYIKLYNGKMVRVFHRNTTISEGEINKFLQRGIQFFYMKGDEYAVVVSEFLKRANSVLTVDEQRFSQLSKLALFGHDTTKKLINRLGVKKEVIAMANDAVETVLKLEKENPTIHKLFSQFIKREDYITEHSILLSFITTAMLKEMDQDSVMSVYKMTLASFFHDIKVPEEMRQSIEFRCNTANEGLLSKSDNRNYNKHPQAACDLLNKLSNIPPDVFRIIEQHHEAPNGKGLPHKLDHTGISPYAALFIVAEDFIAEIYRAGHDTFNMLEILHQMERRFDKGYFKVALIALNKALAQGDQMSFDGLTIPYLKESE